MLRIKISTLALALAFTASVHAEELYWTDDSHSEFEVIPDAPAGLLPGDSDHKPFSTAKPPAKSAIKPAVKPKNKIVLPTITEQLEMPMTELRERTKIFSNQPASLASADIETLEGTANAAVLSRAIKSIYAGAAKQKWTQNAKFQIFSIDSLVANSNAAHAAGAGSRPGGDNGVRIAIFTLRSGKNQRGILLTSNFQSPSPAQLRQSYADGSIVKTIDDAAVDFEAYASELIERVSDGNSRISRYLPLNSSGTAWVVDCESTIAGRYCLNARMFDAFDNDPSIFYDTLLGIQDSNTLVRNIRKQNLNWPIDRAFISRGFKACSCNSKHYGLDLATPIGTPVRAVANGTVRDTKSYSGWGRAVVVAHKLPDGTEYISLYAHLSKYRKGLKPGMELKRGEIIALSGNTGTSYGPHLHLEIRNLIEGKEPLTRSFKKTDRPLDPLRVLDMFNVFIAM